MLESIVGGGAGSAEGMAAGFTAISAFCASFGFEVSVFDYVEVVAIGAGGVFDGLLRIETCREREQVLPFQGVMGNLPTANEGSTR